MRLSRVDLIEHPAVFVGALGGVEAEKVVQFHAQLSRHVATFFGGKLNQSRLTRAARTTLSALKPKPVFIPWFCGPATHELPIESKPRDPFRMTHSVGPLRQI